MGLLERFLRYVAIDTQSDPTSTSSPSTAKQLVLLEILAKELNAMGLSDVELHSRGYLTATIPATPGMENKPVVGFIAHVDTSPDLCGAGVKPQVIENYDGGDVRLSGSEPPILLSPCEFPELTDLEGDTLITTDGTTLLGADDKAGVAAIVTAAEYLLAHPETPHGPLRIAFTCDEEIGRGVEFFDVERFGAVAAYTVDGGGLGELEYENFNAAQAHIAIRGRNIHPGSAKGKMINALHVAHEFDSLLPAAERPENTEDYEGFYHLTSLCGGVDSAQMEYIIRDHSREKFEQQKEKLTAAACELNKKYGEGTVSLTLRDQYYNMREKIEQHPEVVEKAKRAMERAGITPIIRPIRGGTDGAQLSHKGLPCPNIFTGGMNFHSLHEYCSLHAMQKATETIINLAHIWAE